MLIEDLQKRKWYLYSVGDGVVVKVRYKRSEKLNRYLFEEKNGLDIELTFMGVELFINEIK